MATQYTLDDLNNLLNQQKRLSQQLTLNQIEQEEIFAEAQQTGGQATATQFNRYEQLLEQETQIESNLIDLKYEIDEARIQTGQYVPVGNATQSSNNVDPAVSPAAAQAEESFDEFADISRDVQAPPEPPPQPPAQVQEYIEPVDEFSDIERNLSAEPVEPARVEEYVEPVDELSNIGRDISVQPDVPVQDPSPYSQLSQEQLSQQLNSTKAALDSLEALPTAERRNVQTQIDALQNQLDELDDETARRSANGQPVGPVRVERVSPAPVDKTVDTTVTDYEFEAATAANEAIALRAQREAEQAALDAQANALLEAARNQATVAEQRAKSGLAVGDGDWRVRLRLAPNSNYLYKSESPGILEPLSATDGVVFPYTPRISTAYMAEYNSYNPTHNNYNYHFYKGSKIDRITLEADFTAQDTNEANYLLAVIQFFKSATKMFYGQDPERGSPPPLLYLTGLGQYQYNEHPCVIQEFNYNLPNDVDYIRAGSRQINGGNSLQYKRPLTDSPAPSYSLSATWDRLRGAGLPDGAQYAQPVAPNLGLSTSDGAPTYVPTKISIMLTLLPVQSRRQISTKFSLRDYANGDLLKKGYW